jgi:very-short-patch-repair endonuclease
MGRKPITPMLLNRVRHMRPEDTYAEKIAWELLRNRRMFGLKFRRQVPIESFIVDFYCHELRLIFELDGEIHDDLEQIEKDGQRNSRLRDLGYRILRVANGMVMYAADLFAEKIRQFMMQK